MNEEERKAKEEEVKKLREAADAAHKAAQDSDGTDEALNKAAEDSEEAVAVAQKELDEAPPVGDEEEEEGEVIDFEKELAGLGGEQPAQKTELEKAERSLHFNAERVRELGGDPTKIVKPKEVPAPEEGQFVTRDDLHQRDLRGEVGRLAKTEAEAKVILWHAEHSIKQTGDPAKDAENAYMIAHKGKIQRSFSEIRRASYVREAPAGGPGRRPAMQPAGAPALSAQEQSILKRRGFSLQADGTWQSKRYILRYEPKKGFIQQRKQ